MRKMILIRARMRIPSMIRINRTITPRDHTGIASSNESLLDGHAIVWREEWRNDSGRRLQ